MRARWLMSACLAVILAGQPYTRAVAADFDSGGTSLGWRSLDSAMRESYHGHYSDAIGKAGKVIAAAPDFAEAYAVRAAFYMDAGRWDDALADVNRAASMHPEAAALVLMRAEIAVRRRDPATALTELSRASSMPDRTVWKRHYVSFNLYTGSRFYALESIALELKHDDDGALTDFQHMLTFETVYPWYILNFHCYNAAVAGLPEMAELSCDEAIQRQGHDRGAYDSRGLAHLKMRQWAKAIADYNEALADLPDLTLALYGRGLAKIGLGDTAGGRSDLLAASQGEPDIANIMTRLGVKT